MEDLFKDYTNEELRDVWTDYRISKSKNVICKSIFRLTCSRNRALKMDDILPMDDAMKLVEIEFFAEVAKRFFGI